MSEVFKACKKFQIKPGKALNYLEIWDNKMQNENLGSDCGESRVSKDPENDNLSAQSKADEIDSEILSYSKEIKYAPEEVLERRRQKEEAKRRREERAQRENEVY